MHPLPTMLCGKWAVPWETYTEIHFNGVVRPPAVMEERNCCWKSTKTLSSRRKRALVLAARRKRRREKERRQLEMTRRLSKMDWSRDARRVERLRSMVERHGWTSTCFLHFLHYNLYIYMNVPISNSKCLNHGYECCSYVRALRCTRMFRIVE